MHVADVITASEPSWAAPFTGLSPRAFGKLVTVLRRGGADAVRRGRPWSLPLEGRALLVAAYWRTNLTVRQLGPLFGISKSPADRIIDDLGPMLAGYSTAHQVVIDANTRLVVVGGRPLPGNRHDAHGWEESGAKAAVGNTTTIADGGYQGTGLVIPHRKATGQAELLGIDLVEHAAGGDQLEFLLQVVRTDSGRLAVDAAVNVACWCETDHATHDVDALRLAVDEEMSLPDAFRAGAERLTGWLADPYDADHWRARAGLPPRRIS